MCQPVMARKFEVPDLFNAYRLLQTPSSLHNNGKVINVGSSIVLDGASSLSCTHNESLMGFLSFIYVLSTADLKMGARFFVELRLLLEYAGAYLRP